MNKDDVIVSELHKAIAGDFGISAVKVELEAQFNRGGSSDCYDCDGEGEYRCSYCEDGEIYNDATEDYDECGECEGSGYITCDCRDTESNFNSEVNCHDWIMEKLSHYGLAERTSDLNSYAHIRSHWKPVLPLTYAEFYRDGSVDSEFTFTLLLNDPSVVLLLPRFVEIFNELGEEIGNGMEVDGAGMHMAFLHDPDGKYPSNYQIPEYHFNNFKRAMSLLQPALFFLGATNENSRGLGYRKPGVSTDKYSSISVKQGAVEFRVFDTCYDNPEQVLDNLVVMCKAMRYWSDPYTPTGLDRVTTEAKFGVEGGYNLDRFYASEVHIDLLNAGLRKLKPNYLTVKEIKKQRKFTKTKNTFKGEVEKVKKDAELSYKEYENRYEWKIKYSLLDKKTSLTYNASQQGVAVTDEELARIEQESERYAEEIATREPKITISDYIDKQIKTWQNKVNGQYTIKA